MIFVTVGTHEQPFDRLVSEVDRLKQEGKIAEDVFIQTGYSNHEPRYCEHKKFISFDEMNERIRRSRVVITHGGPGSIMSVLYNEKIPIVVPRQKIFSEHVDNHQMVFTKKLEEHNKIISVYDIKEIAERIHDYEQKIEELEDTQSEKIEREKRVKEFAIALDEICQDLVKGKN
jgi:UDP-N-acetylglucosamine transferase subunit ALG13